ncbi:MAG: hypothetical protein RL110_1166 [Bacteroidota bacterium]|jgi:hypothetical protein
MSILRYSKAGIFLLAWAFLWCCRSSGSAVDKRRAHDMRNHAKEGKRKKKNLVKAYRRHLKNQSKPMRRSMKKVNRKMRKEQRRKARKYG